MCRGRSRGGMPWALRAMEESDWCSPVRNGRHSATVEDCLREVSVVRESWMGGEVVKSEGMAGWAVAADMLGGAELGIS